VAVRGAGEAADRHVVPGRARERADGRRASVAGALAGQDEHGLAGDARADRGLNGLQRLVVRGIRTA
jgi:hypothetical protein